ncbi:alpha/beta hydrolase [Cyanobium sp. Morenito 9A2]|uniref:alpha/beta hydrolase n=1 Tax=Cyanobium sp. Morenito 9A2 TaxID=2823718 RepID=UPI0020CEB7DA|nr:esterase [Cyanobium sp. Morenito 9A2]MCP9849623.1 esterase [Cyanobium sp. Morenito 9A2]
MADDQLRTGPAGASHRLVLLHGWGADADDLLELGELLVGGDTEVVALRAPEPHPLGVGRQWYDLQPIDWTKLPAARALLEERLIALGASVPLERTSVLGFSQGAAMGLDVASGLPIAGLIACSGYPHQDWQPQAPLTRVLLTHGTDDPVVPYGASEEVARRLKGSGGDVELRGFSGGHTIDPMLFPVLRDFLKQSRR